MRRAGDRWLLVEAFDRAERLREDHGTMRPWPHSHATPTFGRVGGIRRPDPERLSVHQSERPPPKYLR